MTALDVRPVDLRGPLPTGTTVLEASAGTGKTYTIAGLVTRYVAEGHARLDQLLVVTFGRAATSELRTRVRERLVCARDALADPVAARHSDDPVVALLAEGDAAAHSQRLVAALADFDAATVATTHEFCLQALHELGTAADLDPGTVLVEQLDDLVVEVSDDLYLQFYARPGAPAPHVDHAVARSVARAAVRDPQALLRPDDAPPGSVDDVRVRFAAAVRAEVERRKRALRLLGFDDLLSRLRDALAHPVTGGTARARLRERFRVVLVDEFQDTDPVQWDVLRLAFAGSRALVVVGDPKQAIYAFRGADVRAYLAAAGEATARQELDTNWRSDARVLDGLHTLLRGAALGSPEIVVRPVRAGHRGDLLGPAEDPTPVRLRVLQREGLVSAGRGLVQVDCAREAVARDVASSAVELLGAGATVTPRGTGAAPRPLAAGDVAVLVRTGRQAQLVRDALLDAGVPTVLTGTTSVFATPAARDWVVLLEALEQPHRTGRVRRLALTSLVGRTAQQVDAGGQEATDELALQVRRWAEVLGTRGVAGLFAAVAQEQDLAARLLRRAEGERLVTDLRHVAEALHAEQGEAQLGLTGLLSWLRARVADAGGDLDQERSRRLDTDAAAVQVVTVHTSKGLQFPVVLVPYGWDTAGGGSRDRLPRTHGPGGERLLHVGGRESAGHAAACQEQDAEEAGEELRLLYVAVTRTIGRLVLWWTPGTKTATAPLHRLLFGADPGQLPTSVPVPPDDVALRRLRALAAEGAGVAVEVVPVGAPPAELPAPTRSGDVELVGARFDRDVDLGWRRASYTALTRAAHEQRVGSEPEAAAEEDESDDAPPADAGHEVLRVVPSPMAGLPAGTAFGTLVHSVLEEAVFEQAGLDGDVRAELRAAAARHLRARGSALSPDALADALVPAVSTPLGPLAGGARWRDVAVRDRLTELEFELPLAGGDTPSGRVRLGQVAALLRAHLPPGDPVAPYADLLAPLGDQPLRGYLTGSIDAVLRVGEPPRYVVVDHKTNRLADADTPLTAWHYRREALDAAVLRAHYPLQALLYEVALHRYLRWRQAGYDPERHLGGVLYLFLRGMAGDAGGQPADGAPPGVWSWQPPAGLVVALSDLLAGAAP